MGYSTASKVWLVKRHEGSTMSGCLGQLATGALVRVTVEVLEDPPMPTTCQNPWSGHWGRRDSRKPYDHCIGDGS